MLREECSGSSDEEKNIMEICQKTTVYATYWAALVLAVKTKPTKQYHFSNRVIFIKIYSSEYYVDSKSTE